MPLIHDVVKEGLALSQYLYKHHSSRIYPTPEQLGPIKIKVLAEVVKEYVEAQRGEKVKLFFQKRTYLHNHIYGLLDIDGSEMIISTNVVLPDNWTMFTRCKINLK